MLPWVGWLDNQTILHWLQLCRLRRVYVCLGALVGWSGHPLPQPFHGPFGRSRPVVSPSLGWPEGGVYLFRVVRAPEATVMRYEAISLNSWWNMRRYFLTAAPPWLSAMMMTPPRRIKSRHTHTQDVIECYTAWRGIATHSPSLAHLNGDDGGQKVLYGDKRIKRVGVESEQSFILKAADVVILLSCY